MSSGGGGELKKKYFLDFASFPPPQIFNGASLKWPAPNNGLQEALNVRVLLSPPPPWRF